jgi:hypothetical protein
MKGHDLSRKAANLILKPEQTRPNASLGTALGYDVAITATHLATQNAMQV